MFEGFANVWTIVGLARTFAAGRLHPLQVAGEKVVLFRDDAGSLVALVDRCPHRGVALSLGRLQDGVVECPFHGWCFDAQGRNCNVPWNPDAKRAQLGATPLPVRELAGFVWLYTGQDPADEPQPTEAMLNPRIVLLELALLWNVHWTRAMENMLDSPHLPFVHKRSIGKRMIPLSARRMDIAWSSTDYGARLINTIEDDRTSGRLDYRWPNAMELFIDPRGKTFRFIAVCLPVDDTHTRMCIYSMRDFARSRLFNPAFNWSSKRIALEDQEVLESSQPLAVPSAGEEKSVRTDAPTLAFRKLYFERLASSSSQPVPLGD